MPTESEPLSDEERALQEAEKAIKEAQEWAKVREKDLRDLRDQDWA